jgi:c-di-GMP-binding flagellar brake protein YcgR
VVVDLVFYHLLDEAMEAPDRRKYPRLRQSFRVELFKQGSRHSLDGTSVDVSQGGAFIRTEEWRAFNVKDCAVIAFSLPPDYTGQEKTIRLQGEAFITRVDQKNKGIGVEFTRKFRNFEPVPLANAVGQT